MGHQAIFATSSLIAVVGLCCWNHAENSRCQPVPRPDTPGSKASCCDSSNATTSDDPACTIDDCAACEELTEPISQSPPNAVLKALDGSLSPLIDSFNANKDKVRVIALVSPTCAGCVEGAHAVQESIIEKYPEDELSIHIVWEPMLRSDNEDAARRSSAIFPGPEVHQYYDARRISGWAFTNDIFPDASREMLTSLPEDHMLRKYITTEKTGPMWDIFFVYAPDIEWHDTVPTPTAWVKQVTYNSLDHTGLMWKNDFRTEPQLSNLMDEVGLLMESVLPPDQTNGRRSDL